MNRVAVVVLNYKGIEDTVTCLDSLSKQTYANFQIVAVENGSNDNSTTEFKKLEAKYGSTLQTLYNDKNLGFAGGVNTGISWALANGFDYVALLNNDAIPDERWLTELMEAFKVDETIAIVTGLLLHADGKTIDSTGDWFTKWGLPFPRNRNELRKMAPESGFVFSASGGSSLYKTDLFRAIGLFDENFFAYYEDTDVSFRTQLAGKKVYYTNKAIAYHDQGKTSMKIPGFTTVQTFKNLPMLFLKNTPRQLLFSVGIRFYFAYLLIYLNAIKNGRGIPATKGLIKSIQLLPHTLSERKYIQSSACVDHNYIRSILWDDLPPDQTGIRKFRSIFVRNAR